MPKKKELTPEEQFDAYVSEIEALKAQNAVTEERSRDLAGFQREAIDLRESVNAANERAAVAERSLEIAVREAAEARSALKSQASAGSGDAEIVAAAKQLAAAVKRLT